ncbi:MAG: 16S rRNA (uracil(1498)-N(3))-methyltransferase [Deltaproteobacteria bacterium]|nr:16S rRNA (uracil(1498)-N(3))-methyltransferase [Deltaproteobacteria bacterium]MBW1952963.1 16S rRNA (uracil(1498)-N(3))-methyltransferase [Deltaproteobacteria bacterium]MBW1987489.1 16S rRNA (uracil(1498)-N(3))-methyltransferase [Deltaproteobacteria bacterium]MBW2134527.1 16S rRNA (uracil(1498)-N(3))-methyltransferase [Deltaproteobacteria bacterium]
MISNNNHQPLSHQAGRRRFFAPPDQITGSEIRLSASETHHLARVLRLGVGTRVEIFDGQGQEYEAEVMALEAEEARLQIIQKLPDRAVASLSLTLGLALARAETFDLAVRQATEMGVTRLIPFYCERSLVNPAVRQPSRQQRWQRLALETLKSCQRSRLPEIHSPQSFAEVLQCPEAVKIMFWEEKRSQAPGMLLRMTPAPASVRLLIGPEGGFTAAEAEQAQAAGFALLGLGPWRLKVETAALAALAIIQYAWGDLAG